MEPDTSREIQAFAGCPQLRCRREKTSGEEAKGGEGSSGMLKPIVGSVDTAEDMKAQRGDDGEAKKQSKIGEKEEIGKYEDELDPRIQVCQ